MRSIKIEPLKGVGEVLLGSSKDEIRQLLGEPDVNNREDIGDGYFSEEWEYKALGLELVFIGSDILDQITVSAPNAELDGLYPIGMSIQDLSARIPEIVINEDSDSREASYEFMGKEALFWVKDGCVESIILFAGNRSETKANHSANVSSWGLRDTVEQDFTAKSYSAILVWFASCLSWIYMLSGFAVGGLWLWPFLSNSLDRRAIRVGQDIEGLMYDTNFGIGLLVLIFAWIVAAALLSGFTVRLTGGTLRQILFFGVLDDQSVNPFNKKALSETLLHASDYVNADEMIRFWCDRYRHYALKWLIPLVVIAAPVLYQDMNSYQLYTIDGIYRVPFLPWQSKGLIPWRDADYVELGCNQTKDGPSIVYDVTFKDGWSKRIEGGIPFPGRSWLDSMEVINSALQDSGTEFRRWKWLDRDPMHPQCLSSYLSSLGDDDGKRLMKLLRRDDALQ